MAATALATDTLDLLEERIQRTVSLVTTLRDERDMARLETSEAQETNTRLSAELEALRTDKAEVHARLEKLLGHIDQISAA